MNGVCLGEIVEIKGGGTPDKSIEEYWGGDIPWASVKDFKDTTISRTKDFITAAGVANSATQIIPAGNIIVPTRMAVGKAAINEIDLAINQDLKAILPSKRVERQYLLHALLANAKTLEDQATGATVKGITLDTLRTLRIPLPPLEEQRRIAGILDQADALRRLRTRALDRLNTLGQAIFHEMFGDMRTNELGWEEGVTLGDLADVVSGITKGRKVKSESLREVPYLAVSNVQDRFLKMDVVKTIEATEDEIDRYRLRRDDLLLTEGGDPDKLGRGTLWKEQLPECIHQNHVFRVRVRDGRVRPTFLSWQLGSERGKQYFLRSAKQTTGIASINKTQINAFPLVLPLVGLQEQFEERLNDLEERICAYETAKGQSEFLFTSLQHRAFRGEL